MKKKSEISEGARLFMRFLGLVLLGVGLALTITASGVSSSEKIASVIAYFGIVFLVASVIRDTDS